MKRIESENMIHFLYRPSMYVGNVTRDNIVSFMHGTDFGKRKEPHWTKLLREFISIRFKINGGAMGWPNQVEIYCNREGLEWTEGFKKLMITMIKDSDQIPFTKAIKDLNKQLEQKDKELKIKYGS